MSSTQRQTSIRDLIEQANSRSVVEPAALIFHGSRCGSTLFTQMARSLPGTIVISEAPPVDQIVRAHASEADRIAWLRALISVLGRNGTRGKRHLFVKFDAWHILDLPLIRLAFPGVPCVFLYRDPAAVIASQLRMPGLQMIPGMIDPSIVGLDLAGLLALDREEQCARMIGAIYAAALGAAKTRQLALLGYEDFWESACSLLLTLCRTRDDAVTRARLDEVRQFDAKTPSMPYERSNVRTASARIRDVSNRYAQAYYEELEAIRMSMMQPHATGNLSSGPAGQTH
jgi:hypothetical protein